MHSIPNSAQLPTNPQASSLHTKSSDGDKPAGRQTSLRAVSTSGIADNVPDSTPRPVNIADRSTTVPARKTIYYFKCPSSNRHHKVFTELFNHHDGSTGLRLNNKNGTKFMDCSLPFSSFTAFKRKYTDPHFEEDKHIKSLILLNNSLQVEGCLDFLLKNNIVEPVGEAVDIHDGTTYPIVQLILNKETADTSTFIDYEYLPSLIEAHSGIDFVHFFPEVKEYMKEQPITKEVMSDGVQAILNRYINGGGLDSLDRCTFRHIVIFLETGQKTARLEVACRDFGYSMEELERLHMNNINAIELASEVVSRE